MRGIRERLSFANVMSVVAIFIALGGTAWALSENSVGSRALKPNSVKASELAASALQYSIAQSEPKPVSPGSLVLEARCPAGRAIGGGINAEAIPAPADLVASEPLPGDEGWRGIFNVKPPGGDAIPSTRPEAVVAICTK